MEFGHLCTGPETVLPASPGRVGMLHNRTAERPSTGFAVRAFQFAKAEDALAHRARPTNRGLANNARRYRMKVAG